MNRLTLVFCAAALTPSTPFAYAKTVNVKVQCKVGGPLYTGTLVIPDVAGFACKSTDRNGAGFAYAENARQPSMELRFNELDYAIPPAYDEESVRYESSDEYPFNSLAKCKQALADGWIVSAEYGSGNSSQHAIERSSELSADASINFDTEGNVANGQVGRCAFKVKRENDPDSIQGAFFSVGRAIQTPTSPVPQKSPRRTPGKPKRPQSHYGYCRPPELSNGCYQTHTGGDYGPDYCECGD